MWYCTHHQPSFPQHWARQGHCQSCNIHIQTQQEKLVQQPGDHKHQAESTSGLCLHDWSSMMLKSGQHIQDRSPANRAYILGWHSVARQSPPTERSWSEQAVLVCTHSSVSAISTGLDMPTGWMMATSQDLPYRKLFAGSFAAHCCTIKTSARSKHLKLMDLNFKNQKATAEGCDTCRRAYMDGVKLGQEKRTPSWQRGGKCGNKDRQTAHPYAPPPLLQWCSKYCHVRGFCWATLSDATYKGNDPSGAVLVSQDRWMPLINTNTVLDTFLQMDPVAPAQKALDFAIIDSTKY